MTRLHSVLRRTAARAAAAALIASAIAACGGGGSSARAPATLPAPAPAPTLPTVKDVKPGVWVVMGSSSAAGAGAPAGKGWVDLLQASLRDRGAQFANIARGGTTTYHGMSASAQSVAGRPAPDPDGNVDQALSRNPVVLVVSYPTNDTALGYSVDETVNNILAIRAAALARDVAVIVLSTQPRNLTNDQLAQLQAIDQKLNASVGPCLVNVRAALAGADGRLAPGNDAGDGVHPSEAGHRLIAERVNSVLNEAKCIKASV